MKTVRTLSLLLSFLAGTASLGGLTIKHLYRDSEFYKLIWQTNDWVTLLLIVPSLVVVVRLSGTGLEWAKLLWMGLLAYLFYNYAFYVFGAAFNWFFLLYAAILAMSIYALAMGLWHLDVPGIGSRFSGAPLGPEISALSPNWRRRLAFKKASSSGSE